MGNKGVEIMQQWILNGFLTTKQRILGFTIREVTTKNKTTVIEVCYDGHRIGTGDESITYGNVQDIVYKYQAHNDLF